MAVFVFLLLTAFSASLEAEPPEVLRTGEPGAVMRAYRSAAEELRKDSYGWTPLMIAAAANPYPDTIRLLVKAGEKVSARSLDGWTPLMFAAAFNPEPEIVETLLELGADPEDRTEDSWTPIFGAARYRGEKVRLMNLETSLPGSRDRRPGWTALFFAARFSASAKVAETLLKNGANPNDADETGRTPAMYAEAHNPETRVLTTLRTAAGR